MNRLPIASFDARFRVKHVVNSHVEFKVNV